MKHREPVLKKLDSIESNLNKILFAINRGNIDNCRQIIEIINEQLDQVKTYIETEPIVGSELNR